MNIPVNTAQLDVEDVIRIEITDACRRLAFVPELFATPLGESMAMNFLHKHSNYDGGCGIFTRFRAG